MAGGDDLEQEATGVSYEAYLKHRAHLLEVQREAQGKYDQSLFYLSSGAIALSITFLDKIAVGAQMAASPMVVAAWLCFLVSVVFVVASHALSSEVHGKEITQLDECYADHSRTWKSSRLNALIRWSNVFSGILFVFGCLFFLLFAALNFQVLGEHKAMNSNLITGSSE